LTERLAVSKKFFILLANGLVYKFTIRFGVYFIAILPFILTVTYLENLSSVFMKVALLAVSIIAAPFIIIMTTGLLVFVHPKQPAGSVEIFSKNYFTWLRRNLLYEIITSSTFLNNTLNRIDPVKSLYYKLAGSTNPYLMIIAPNVMLLDPDRLVFGKETFIGINSMISGHIIKGNRLIVRNVTLGDYVKIGSGCVISCGVTIGDNTKIDFGVTVGTACRIGKNVTIFAETKIDDGVTIEDGAVIGKFCKIGKKAAIPKDAYVRSFEIVEPRQLYESQPLNLSNRPPVI
jgi:carbonic anhydrase/acetyltransferase-like protein (isoleucine patch superfamily)